MKIKLVVVMLACLLGIAVAGSDVMPYNEYAGAFTAYDMAHVLSLGWMIMILTPFFLAFSNRHYSPEKVFMTYVAVKDMEKANAVQFWVIAYKVVVVVYVLLFGLAGAFIFSTDGWVIAPKVWGIITFMCLWFAINILQAIWPSFVYNDFVQNPDVPSPWMALSPGLGYVLHVVKAILVFVVAIGFLVIGGLNGCFTGCGISIANGWFFGFGGFMMLVAGLVDFVVLGINLAVHRQASVRRVLVPGTTGFMSGRVPGMKIQ
jgi:hypothetical protein